MSELDDVKGLFIDQIPVWIADYENFQEMPLELSADIDRMLETNSISMSPDVEEIRSFLSDRYSMLQDEIDKWKAASTSGSKILLVKKEE